MKEHEYILMTATHSPCGEFQELRLSFCDGGELAAVKVGQFPGQCDEDIYKMAERAMRERGHLVRYDRASDAFWCLDDDTMQQIAGYMDDDIREELSGRYDCNTNARFLARYAERNSSIWDYLGDFDISRDDLAGF